jgi:hypothetical protein
LLMMLAGYQRPELNFSITCPVKYFMSECRMPLHRLPLIWIEPTRFIEHRSRHEKLPDVVETRRALQSSRVSILEAKRSAKDARHTSYTSFMPRQAIRQMSFDNAKAANHVAGRRRQLLHDIHSLQP